MNDETSTIQSTTNYNKFTLLQDNREQSRGHIEALKRACETRGNLTKITPLVVNERMEVIDGQHRLTALAELGLPVYYSVTPGLRTEDAIAMNILQKPWTMDDYAMSYANSGNINYQKYLALKEDYGFSNTVTLHSVNDLSKGNGRLFKAFRLGEFELTDGRLELAKSRLGALSSIAEWVPMVGARSFAIAFFDVLAAPGYDQQRMERKLALVGRNILKDYTSPEDYRRALEEIYNYQQGEASRVRLY